MFGDRHTRLGVRRVLTNLFCATSAPDVSRETRMLGTPLIPRKTFFENANALNPQISPDGRWLAWIAAADGVMNVWVAPRDDLARARPLTRQTERPTFAHAFARTNAHVLFQRDKDGDENFNLWCVGLDGSAARNLTPY